MEASTIARPAFIAHPGILVNCDRWPKIMEGSSFTVKEHHMGGRVPSDPSRITLSRPPAGMFRRTPTGHELYRYVFARHIHPLNAVMMDWYLEHPDVIPDEWKTAPNDSPQLIVFWGTIFFSDGKPYVMYFYFEDGKWVKSARPLDSHFGSDCVIASYEE